MSDEIGQKHRMNPNSLANLKPAWQPGQSGNPGGNYKNTPKISNAYDKLLALSPEELSKFKPSNMAEKIALKQIQAAASSSKNLSSVREITDRTEGRAKQSVTVEEHHTGDSDEAFRMFYQLVTAQGLNLSEEVARQQFNAMREADQQRLM